MDTEIQSIRSILHLIYHRNKNQHQKAKWWRWLSMLKRTVSALAPLGSKEIATSSHLQHLHLHLIPKCYQAFSTVIADNQFSTLGIVLFAATARLAKATGMRYPSAKSVSTRVDVKQKSKSQPQPAVVKAVVDRGERISRGDGDGGDLPIPMRKKQQSRSNDEGSEKPDKEKKKVKKSSSKKKKNAIDDLFDGLF